MKKLLCLLLAFTIGSGAVAETNMCRDFIATSEESQKLTINSRDLTAAESPELGRRLLKENQILKIEKTESIIGWAFRKMRRKEIDSYSFNLEVFNSEKKVYLEALKKTRTLDIALLADELVPKTFEQRLAFMEASFELNPQTAGFDVIFKWLGKATKQDVKKMMKLTEFKDGKSPVALYTSVAKMYLLVHTPIENIDEVLNSDLNRPAADLIYKRVVASLLSETFTDALDTLGFARTERSNARLKYFVEENPTIAAYAFNVALGTIEMMVTGFLWKARPPDINLVQSKVDWLTKEEKTKILNLDFSDFDPKKISPYEYRKNEINLIPTAIRENRIKTASMIIGVALFALLAYFVQEEARFYYFSKHSFLSTMSTKDRADLEAYLLIKGNNSQANLYEESVSLGDFEKRKNDLRHSTDYDLEVKRNPFSQL